jgi:hypothetical protein
MTTQRSCTVSLTHTHMTVTFPSRPPANVVCKLLELSTHSPSSKLSLLFLRLDEQLHGGSRKQWHKVFGASRGNSLPPAVGIDSIIKGSLPLITDCGQWFARSCRGNFWSHVCKLRASHPFFHRLFGRETGRWRRMSIF